MSMTTQENTVEMSLEPAARSVPLVAGDTPAMREWAEQLVARARAEGVELTGDDGLLTAMIRQVLQTGLEVELAESPWESWRLLTLETRMELCQARRHRGSRRRVGIPIRRSSRRSGWFVSSASSSG